MTSKSVAEMLADLRVGRTHSRPHVSKDNPFSEAVNKTLKYCPSFPHRFGSIEDARVSARPSSRTTTITTATPASERVNQWIEGGGTTGDLAYELYKIGQEILSGDFPV